MKLLILAATAAAAFTASAANAETPFVAKAIQGDMAEVKMGMLAEKKGTTPAIKEYGKMLVKDHGAHEVKAKALAKSMGVKSPTGPSLEQKAAYTMVSMKSGADFDAAFKQHMIDDHTKDIAEYQGAADGGNAKVAAFAKKTLPTLEAHLDAANKL